MAMHRVSLRRGCDRDLQNRKLLAKHLGTSHALGHVILTAHMTRPLRNGLGLVLLDLCEAGPGKLWSVHALVTHSSRPGAAAVI